LWNLGFGEDEETNIFIWDEIDIEHIAKHGVETYEAEEAILDEDRVRFNAHSGIWDS
jgi:hypothetical protein